MWMVSDLLYSTIIFIGRPVPDDCLNTVVSVAAISESAFKDIMTEIKSLVFTFFSSMERGQKNIYSCFS